MSLLLKDLHATSTEDLEAAHDALAVNTGAGID